MEGWNGLLCSVIIVSVLILVRLNWAYLLEEEKLGGFLHEFGGKQNLHPLLVGLQKAIMDTMLTGI